MDPDDVETLLITGHICVALKKFDDAKDYYEQILALEPGNEDANKNLQALIKRQNGRSSARPDTLKDVTVSSAKVESTDLDTEESENQDAEHQTSVSIFISLDGIQNRVKQCIESIAAHTEEPHEVIFINNGATKGVLKWAQNLAQDNAHYQLVKCDKTHSWAQCLNQAVKAAAGEYIVLMHNDVMVADRWLSGMHQCFRTGSGIGVVGPMTNETSGIQKVYFSDDWDPNRLESDAEAFYEQNQQSQNFRYH
jgi:tetratricopeptide (TPR) repeat protein